MGTVIYEPAITWMCPKDQTVNFSTGEEYDLDDPEDFHEFAEHANALLEEVNEAHASANLPPLTFATAEARGLFDGFARAPKVVTCSKCGTNYDCISEDEAEDDTIAVGN